MFSAGGKSQYMGSPSSKTLVVLAFGSMVGGAALVPTFYPGPMPLIGSDGLPMHGPDGKILVHRDMAEFYRMSIPSWILFTCSVALTIWLFVRLLRFLYGRIKSHKTVA